VSYCHVYVTRDSYKELEERRKFVKLLSRVVVPSLLAVNLFFGYLNIKEKGVIERYQEIRREHRAYYEKWEELFGKNGLSSKSLGEPSISQVIDSFRRMDYSETNYEGSFYGDYTGLKWQFYFPKPTLKNLEKAIRSHKDEQPKPFSRRI